MATATATKTKTTTAAAAAQQQTTEAEFLSVGALFASAKVEGDWSLLIDPELLDLLGIEHEKGVQYKLLCKGKTSKAGKPYQSLFLCVAEED